jgi:hypothetical protein
LPQSVRPAQAVEPQPRRPANNRVDYAEDQAERQARTERQFREQRALNGQPLATPNGVSSEVDLTSGATALRTAGDLVSFTGRTVDDPVGDVVEANQGLLGAVVQGVGAVTGNDVAKDVGRLVSESADEYGDQVADQVLVTASNARNDAFRLAEEEDGKKYAYEVNIPRSRYPESARHITEAQNGVIWRGETWKSGAAKPKLLTVDRDGANKRRNQSLQGIKPGSKIGRPGYDRDEYPYAVSLEGGKQKDGSRASVKYVLAKDNQGSGGFLPSQLANLEDTDQFLVRTTD